MSFANKEDEKRYKEGWYAEHPEYSKTWQRDSYWQHPTFSRLLAKEDRYLNKIKALMHCSNPIGSLICNNCGEQDIDVLCIDHINGGGNRHNKTLNSQGTNICLWLIKNNYPEGYQVLCANCNMKKTRFENWRNGNR